MGLAYVFCNLNDSDFFVVGLLGSIDFSVADFDDPYEASSHNCLFDWDEVLSSLLGDLGKFENIDCFDVALDSDACLTGDFVGLELLEDPVCSKLLE